MKKIPSKPLKSEEAEQIDGATDVSDKDEGTKEDVAKAEKEASEEGSETNGEAAEENTKTEDEVKNSSKRKWPSAASFKLRTLRKFTT